MTAGSQFQPPSADVLPPSSTTGTRKMEYKGSSWHETCFVCHHCRRPIGTQSFIPKDSENFCVPCYEQQHAPQCVQCQKVGWPLWPAWLRVVAVGAFCPFSSNRAAQSTLGKPSALPSSRSF